MGRMDQHCDDQMPTGPMGYIELPELDLPDLTDEETEEVLRGMALWGEAGGVIVDSVR